MGTMRVGIAHDYFKKELRAYSDWRWAWIREICQNGIDCGSKKIQMSFKDTPQGVLAIAENDGPPMTEEELCNKFLNLGGTSKTSGTTIGGFGIAKIVIALGHQSYKIETGDLVVTGEGGEFELSKSGEYVHGTRTTVILSDETTTAETMEEKAVFYGEIAQWGGELLVNGQKINTSFHKGSRRRSFEWGVVYTNKSLCNRLVVRVNGIPMFTRLLSCGDRCVVIELNGFSTNVLQSNRDSLSYNGQHALDQLIAEITVDKNSALAKRNEPRYRHWRGEKLRAKTENQFGELLAAAYATLPQAKEDNEESTGQVVDCPEKQTSLGEDEVETQREEAQYSTINHEFTIKNNTGMSVPSCYHPDNFSAYSKKLVSVWVKCLLVAHEILGRKGSFSVGFIFDDNREAEYERSGEYGEVYYVNPAVVVEQKSSRSRSLKKRWKFSQEGKYSLLADAIHEIAHSMGESWHDENYASKLTSITGILWANHRKFYPCFK